MKHIARSPVYVARALILSLSVAGFAADHGTAAQARAMLQKAISHYKSAGRKQALADFTAKKPPFADGDLYVVCFDSNGIIVANGGFPSNVDTPGDEVIDVTGLGVATAAREATASNGDGVVRYRWVNPVTHNLESKLAFFARVGDDVCGVGAYSPK